MWNSGLSHTETLLFRIQWTNSETETVVGYRLKNCYRLKWCKYDLLHETIPWKHFIFSLTYFIWKPIEYSILEKASQPLTLVKRISISLIIENLFTKTNDQLPQRVCKIQAHKNTTYTKDRCYEVTSLKRFIGLTLLKLNKSVPTKQYKSNENRPSNLTSKFWKFFLWSIYCKSVKF